MGYPGSKLLRRVAATGAVVILAVISGVALGFALPPHNIGILGWIALAPLLIAAGLSHPAAAFGLGFITAAAAGCVLGMPFGTAEGLGNLTFAFTILGAVGGITAAGFSIFYNKLSVPLMIAGAAFLGVTAEYLSTFVFPVNIAIVHHQLVPILQIASVTGVWGLSFLVWLTSAAAAAAVLSPRSAHYIVVTAVIVIIVYVWGLDRATTLPPSERVKVAAVQSESLYDLAVYTEQAAQTGAEAVVWPELALDTLDQGVKQVSSQLDVLLVTGFTYTRDGARPFNSAAIIEGGKTLAVTNKTHLLGKENGMFGRNDKIQAFTPRNFPRSGAAICYDTNFTDVVRKLAAQDAKVIFVPNSDPVTPGGALHHLHAALLPIRAAENSVVIVRSDTRGLSQIIHPSGWVVTGLPMNTKGQVSAEVVLGSGPTIFTRTGDWYAWVSAATAALLLYTGSRRSRSRYQS